MSTNPAEDKLAQRLGDLCRALGITVPEALTELIAVLEERRDLLAIAHPVWRASHVDVWFERMKALFRDEAAARERLEGVKELKARGGQRLEDVPARNKWKARVLAAGGAVCPYCRMPLTTKNTEIDHRVPLARGGRDRESNWQPACRPCNRGKSDMFEDRPLSPWRSAKLFRQLILGGKVTLTPIERFDLLWRSGFRCSRCPDGGTGPLAIVFRVLPRDGGQAVPENLAVVCDGHVTHEEQRCLA